MSGRKVTFVMIQLLMILDNQSVLQQGDAIGVSVWFIKIRDIVVWLKGNQCDLCSIGGE